MHFTEEEMLQAEQAEEYLRLQLVKEEQARAAQDMSMQSQQQPRQGDKSKTDDKEGEGVVKHVSDVSIQVEGRTDVTPFFTALPAPSTSQQSQEKQQPAMPSDPTPQGPRFKQQQQQQTTLEQARQHYAAQQRQEQHQQREQHYMQQQYEQMYNPMMNSPAALYQTPSFPFVPMNLAASRMAHDSQNNAYMMSYGVPPSAYPTSNYTNGYTQGNSQGYSHSVAGNFTPQQGNEYTTNNGPGQGTQAFFST
jgi:hypothetical protein